MTPLESLRTTVSALVAAPVLVAVVLLFVLPGPDVPPMLVWEGIVVLGLAAAALVGTVGYRTSPIVPGTPSDEARRQSRQRFQTGTFVRFALAESVALVGLATAFVVDRGGILVYLLAAAISVGLTVVHVWPGERTIGRTEAALEEQGGTSHLRDALEDRTVV